MRQHRWQWPLLLALAALTGIIGQAFAQSCTPLAPGSHTNLPPGPYCLNSGQYSILITTPPPPPPGPGGAWQALITGPVPDPGQYGKRGEQHAAFDTLRNRIFTFDEQGVIWVYEFLPGSIRIRALNGGARVVGGRRNCAVAYVPGLDIVVQTGCAPAYGLDGKPSNKLLVFRFPDNDTVTVHEQCTTGLCGAPAVANFLAWHPGLGALVGGGGWSGTDQVTKYQLGNPPALPPVNTPWVNLPQSGPAPVHNCHMCLEGFRRTVLRHGSWVYVDPLTHDLYTYNFSAAPGQPTWSVRNTLKPRAIPVNGVVGYDPIRDKIVAWVGIDALYWSTGARTVGETWIYDFATNAWNLGPNRAAGNTTPVPSIGVIPIFVWDPVAERLVLITMSGTTSGFTRLWSFNF